MCPSPARDAPRCQNPRWSAARHGKAREGGRKKSFHNTLKEGGSGGAISVAPTRDMTQLHRELHGLRFIKKGGGEELPLLPLFKNGSRRSPSQQLALECLARQGCCPMPVLTLREKGKKKKRKRGRLFYVLCRGEGVTVNAQERWLREQPLLQRGKKERKGRGEQGGARGEDTLPSRTRSQVYP